MEALPSIRGYPSAVKDLIGGVGDIYIVKVCIVFVLSLIHI